MNEIESTLVKPFYLKVMGLNALWAADDLWEGLVAAGLAVTARDASWMLRTRHWRPIVMGAWFSMAVSAEPVRDDLMAAMSQSQGSLTAPPLATVAALVTGTAAVPAMTTYVEFMTASAYRDGSENVVAAAIEHLGAECAIVPTDEGRRAFRDLHDVAIRLGDAVRAARPH